jgi:argininosuccinate synthase
MRNLDIADSRAKLELYARQGQLGGHAQLIGELEPGGAEQIAEIGSEVDEGDVESLDRAAMEAGTD